MKLANVFKQSSIYLVGDVIRRGVGLVMIPVYTRYLSPSDYGIIELIELFLMVAGVSFGISAISDGMIRIYHEYSDDKGRSEVVSTGIIGVAAAGMLIVAIAAASADRLSTLAFGGPQYGGLIRTAFLAMLFSSLTDIALLYQRIKQRAVFFVAFAAVQLTANVALNIYLIVFAGMGVWGFVLAKLIVTALGSAILLTIVSREISWGVTRAVAGKMARFAGPLILSGGSFFIMHFSDRFFLNHFGTLSEVGIYALAYKFGFVVTYLVGQPFGSVWNVSLYGHVGAERWRYQFARVATYLMFFLVLAAVGLGIFADKVLMLIANPSYLPAAMLVPVIAFGYAFREVGDFFRSMLFINKRVLLFGRITMACAALNLLLDWVLIGQYHAAGAAWATLATWLAYMVTCWVLAYREHRIPYPVRSFVLLCSLATLVCLSAGLLRVLPMIWQWGACGGLVLLFVASNWSFGYFSSEERDCIRQQLAMGRHTLFAVAERFR